MPPPPSVLQIAAQPTFGGGERHVLDLARGLLGRGWRVLVAVPGPGELAERAAACGVATVQIPRPAHPAGYPALAARLVREARAFAPTLVHGHSGYGNLAARMAGAALRVPAVVTWHGVHALHRGGLAGRGQLAGERVLVRAAAAHICVSGADERDLTRVLGLTPERLTRVYLGVPFPPAPPAPGAGERLITVARYHPQKDYDTLFAAVRLLVPRRPALRLEAYGFGPEQARLERRIKALGLEAHVRLRQAPHDAILRAYAAAGVFVLSTHWEGLPYTVLEALASGLPVVASHVGGIPEQVVPGVTGELAAPGDPAALAAALERVLGARETYVRGLAASWAGLRDRFSLEAMVAGVEGVYRRVAPV